MNKINHFFRYTKSTNNYFQKHGKKYLFGMLWAFAIVKMALLFVWFFSTLDLGKSSAQQSPPQVVLTSGNVVSMGCATGATSCDLSNKWIISIKNDAFVNHGNLEELSLSQNALTGIFWVAFPNSLVDLNLAFNKITSLSWIAFPSSLQNLNIASNRLTSLSWIAFPSFLQYLNLYSNGLTNLSWAVLPSSLLRLNLSFNLLKNIDQVVSLSSLQSLDLSLNQLNSMPENTTQLINLRNDWWLNINNNHINYTQLSSELLAFIDQKSKTGRRETQTFTPPSSSWTYNKKITIEILWWWGSSCSFSGYSAMEATTSIASMELESETSAYYCTIGGKSGSYVTVQSSPLISLEHNQIPASNVSMRQVLTGVSPVEGCSIVPQLGTTYCNIASGVTLFSKQGAGACWYGNETQLKIIIPQSTPAGTYSGDVVFTINE